VGIVTRAGTLGVLALTLAGCAGSGNDESARTTTSSAARDEGTTASTAPATSASATTAPATTSTTRPSAKVNANTASIAELTAAFTAAGISTPDRWAREVDEYRPYATNDASFAKLRGELAKYNPAPGVVDQIISTLSL
jgi:hypothetical protein